MILGFSLKFVNTCLFWLNLDKNKTSHKNRCTFMTTLVTEGTNFAMVTCYHGHLVTTITTDFMLTMIL